ncbi:PREDICTED: uncharacterized protein LOC108973201 [Bactrocera latifrons]|uniref:uncharacterized protein LOC108973201 n=1 Tax=Bactrocera latifrons TaxID=174628 RepID=UPI0008DE18B3|nr:PREDICTED: uncharacterized protein LOC108973201 [Bactrocera latifrons]
MLVLGEASKPCFSVSEIEEETQVPLIIATVSASEDKLKDRFNSNLIVIVCLPANPLDLQLLKVLAAKLHRSRQTRIILLFGTAKPTASLLDALTVYWEEQYITNVIGFNDLQSYFYRYYPFPNGHWRRELLNSSNFYFLPHQRDLQGKPFLTLPGQIAPRCLIYVDSAGQQHLSGYVGLLLLTFAEKYNITLQYRYPVIPGEILHLTVLLNFVTNGSLDVAITLVPLSYGGNGFYSFLTYPLELSGWFIVLPCPRPLYYSEIYTIVISAQVIGFLIILHILFSLLDSIIKHQFYKSSDGIIWTDILVNDNIFRGIIGLSFIIKSPHPVLSLKTLYVFLFLLGLFINNMYSAYFQTLFTSPPLQQEILTFDDMRNQNLKVMFDRREISTVKDSLGSDFNRTFKDILLLEDTKIFQRHRRDYDTAYAYSMPESLWSIFEAQQETFERKLYCLAPTLKFFGLLLLGIPLAENSYIMELLNMMTLRVVETGLLQHWRTVTYLDMVTSGQLLKVESKTTEKFHNISIQDIQLPFYLLLCGLSVGGAVFIAELYLFKLKNKPPMRK